MFKLQTNTKKLVKRLALLNCVMAIGALWVSGTAMAAPPTVTTPVQTVADNPGGTHALISWSASDDRGIARQTVWHGVGVGDRYGWSPISVAPTARFVRVSVADNAKHVFTVAVTDMEGNTTSSSRGPEFKRRVIETTNADNTCHKLSYLDGHWFLERGTSYSGGGTLTGVPAWYADRGTASLEWHSEALNVAMIGTLDPWGGLTEVSYYDSSGSLVKRVEKEQYAAARAYRRVISQWRFTRATAGSIDVAAMSAIVLTDFDAIVVFERPGSQTSAEGSGALDAENIPAC